MPARSQTSRLTDATSPTLAARLAALLVLPYLLLGLAWLGASPVGSGPDETDHLVKALSVARLDLGAPVPITATKPVLVRNQSISRAVTIPSRQSPKGLLCFTFKVKVTPTCQPPPPADTGDVTVVTTLGAYPPFLYYPIGLVAGLGQTPAQAVLLGRGVVLVVAMLLFWLAVRHLVRWVGPRAAVGVVVAVTPMTAFCTGILNTSALEIFGALGVATVVVVATRHPDSLTRRGTQLVMLACGSVLVLSRQLGIVTMVALVALLLIRGGWSVLWPRLRAHDPLLLGVVGLLAAESAAVAVWEALRDHPAFVGPLVSSESLTAFPGQIGMIAREAVGWFGWLDVRPPVPYAVAWGVLIGLLLLGGLVLGDGRDRWTLVLMLVVAFGVAYSTYASVFYPVQAGLQGRHILPILVVVPLLAGTVVAERLPRPVLLVFGTIASVAAATLHLGGFWLAAQRYAVGLPARLWFLADAQWSPTLGWAPWLVLATVAVLALAAAFGAVIRVRPTDPDRHGSERDGPRRDGPRPDGSDDGGRAGRGVSASSRPPSGRTT